MRGIRTPGTRSHGTHSFTCTSPSPSLTPDTTDSQHVSLSPADQTQRGRETARRGMRGMRVAEEMMIMEIDEESMCHDHRVLHWTRENRLLPAVISSAPEANHRHHRHHDSLTIDQKRRRREQASRYMIVVSWYSTVCLQPFIPSPHPSDAQSDGCPERKKKL